LSGSGIVQLGNQPLTLSNAVSDTFSGTIVGDGSLILNGGTETLSGTNALTGGVTVNAGTLYVASSTVAYNIANSGTFGFSGSGTVAMSGVVSGTGSVTQNGTGITTIKAPQTYTGPTTITMGTLALSVSAVSPRRAVSRPTEHSTSRRRRALRSPRCPAAAACSSDRRR